MAVSGGFVDVFNGRAAVFAETAEMADEIDAERARRAADRARTVLRRSPGDMIDAQALAALERALTRLRAAEASSRRPSSHRSSTPT
jgi:F-type H+-transporting ATPase subunit epsilon